jgi:hypothetical protein
MTAGVACLFVVLEQPSVVMALSTVEVLPANALFVGQSG